MPVTAIAAGVDLQTPTGSSRTFSVDAGTGTDRVFMLGGFSSGSFGSATYAGAGGFTQVAGVSAGGANMYRQDSPATGVNNLVIPCVAYTSTLAGWCVFSGVDTTTPVGATSSNTVTSFTANTGSLTVPADGGTFAMVGSEYQTSSSRTVIDGTELAYQRNGGSGENWSVMTRDTTGDHSITFASQTNMWGIAAVINPSAVAASFIPDHRIRNFAPFLAQ